MRFHTTLTSLSAIAGTGHRVFWIGFFGLVLASWLCLFRLTASPLPGLSAAEYWAALCISASDASIWPLFGMWGLMAAAMMLPTFAPALRVFAELGSTRASDGRALAALTSGYGLAWLFFAIAAATIQLWLSRLGALPASGQAITPWITAGLTAGAGAYQLGPFKHACLARCRHPLLFYMANWRPGPMAAFGMGARLGLWCIGCCWALMLLGFVGGAMNLLWMGAATLFMTLEKLPEIGRHLTKPLGLLLVLIAAVQAAQAANLASMGG